MIDTMILTIPIGFNLLIDKRAGYWRKIVNRENFKKYLMDSERHGEKLYEVFPKITYTERWDDNWGWVRTMEVEGSLPKILNQTNLQPLTEADGVKVVNKLQEVLRFLTGVSFSDDDIWSAEISRVDYCVDVKFGSVFEYNQVIDRITSAALDPRLDFKKVDYKNGGHGWHIWCGYRDIIFYNKLMEIKSSCSNKKKGEWSKATWWEKEVVDSLDKAGAELMRYEVRFTTKSHIRDELSRIGDDSGDITLRALFSAEKAQKFLMYYWQIIRKGMLPAMESVDLSEVFCRLAKEGIGRSTNFAIIGASVLASQVGGKKMRRLIEKSYPKDNNYAWTDTNKKIRVFQAFLNADKNDPTELITRAIEFLTPKEEGDAANTIKEKYKNYLSSTYFCYDSGIKSSLANLVLKPP